MDSRNEVKSLKKALRALTVMNKIGDASVTEVARALAIPRSTSHRLLETLAAEGYVEKQPNSDYYRLTSQVLELASGFSGRDLVIEVAKPLLAELGRKLDWPLALATPRSTEMVVRACTDWDTPRALERFCVGYGTPMLYAPGGFSYLAYCDDEERERVIGLSRTSPDPRVRLARNRKRLQALLDRVHAQGFCNLEYAAYREGGLAVPLTASGVLVGSIVMRYTKSAMRHGQLESDYVPQMSQLVSDISASFNARVTETGAEWMRRA